MTSNHAILKATKRVTLGNKAKTLRRENKIPAVIYSKKFPSTPIQIDVGEFLKVYKTAGRTKVIDLDIDGKVQPTVIQDMDIHPFKHSVRHVDFYVVNLKEKIVSTVPLSFSGEAEGVKNLGGVLNTNLSEVEVEALPDKMPAEIIVDISVLVDFDSTIHISNIPASKDYKIVSDPEMLVANLISQSEEEEVETQDTVVGTEGEASSEKTNE
jgi:large subunit ribosomal protein L25